MGSPSQLEGQSAGKHGADSLQECAGLKSPVKDIYKLECDTGNVSADLMTLLIHYSKDRGLFLVPCDFYRNSEIRI